jgi:hypothetical protein
MIYGIMAIATGRSRRWRSTAEIVLAVTTEVHGRSVYRPLCDGGGWLAHAYGSCFGWANSVVTEELQVYMIKTGITA